MYKSNDRSLLKSKRLALDLEISWFLSRVTISLFGLNGNAYIIYHFCSQNLCFVFLGSNAFLFNSSHCQMVPWRQLNRLFTELRVMLDTLPPPTRSSYLRLLMDVSPTFSMSKRGSSLRKIIGSCFRLRLPLSAKRSSRV